MKDLTFETLIAVFEEMFGPTVFWLLAAVALVGFVAFATVLLRQGRIRSAPFLRAELVELDRLLFLDRVDDPDSVEAGCFAEIDPASPVVEEICVLADEFRSHLISVAESDDRPQAWAAILAA